MKSEKFNKNNFIIIKNNYPENSTHIGRCIHCDAKEFCGFSSNDFKCECGLSQHYITIQKLRKQKLNEIQNRR